MEKDSAELLKMKTFIFFEKIEKSDENHWKSIEFYIEDSNLHSFRQGIQIFNGWKLILMKNIEFCSKLDIFREPYLVNFFNQQ